MFNITVDTNRLLFIFISCNQCISPLKLWVLIPIMARCNRYNLSMTRVKYMVFSGYSRFPLPINWLPRYSWNIVKSGVKHNIPNPSISWSTADPLIHFRFDSNIIRCLYTGYFDYDEQMVSGLARSMERSTDLIIICRYFHKEPCEKSEDNFIANRKFTK